MPSSSKLKCPQCGKTHRHGNELAFIEPDIIAQLTPEQRRKQVTECGDLRLTSDGYCFVRAVLPIPVHGWHEPYCVGIWAELSKFTFGRILQLWRDPAQGKEPPLKAWLANNMPSFPSTYGLEVRLQLAEPPYRPSVTLVECEHALFQEQSCGITPHRAYEYSNCYS